MDEQVLDDMKRMLDFRAHAGLQMLQFIRQAPQFVLGQRLAFGALHGYMPDDRFADAFGALFHALIAGIAERCDFVAMQQCMRLGHVGDITRCADDAVRSA